MPEAIQEEIPSGRNLTAPERTGVQHSAPADEGDVSSLVRLAIDRNVPVEVLERLVALQERVTERAARKAFFDALTAFQQECPEIPKNRKVDYVTKSGSKVKYNYAEYEEIARVIRPILARHGLSYSFAGELKGASLMDVVCVLRHIDGHVERTPFPTPIDTNASMSPSQKNGAALTYGRRQSLISALGLTTADEDNDGAEPGAQPGDDEFITEEQARNLDVLIDDAGADKAKFLRFLGVASLGELRKGQLAEATRSLEEKRRRA